MADDDARIGDPETPRDFPDRASEAAAPHRSGAENESGELAGDAPAPLARPGGRTVRLQPRWLRPAIVALVATAHASALIALSSIRSPAPPAVATIEATVIAAGDEAPVTTAAAQAPEPGGESVPEAKPSAPTPPAPEPTPAPPPVAAAEETPPLPPVEKPPAAETQPPQIVAPPETPPPVAKDEAPAPASARLEEPPREVEREFETPPPPPRVQTPLRPKPEAKPEPAARPKAARPDAAERPKPHKSPAPAESGAAAAAQPGGSEAHHVGTATGQPVDSGASRASYAALVVAEIQAHRFYPESARQRSVQGAVGVSFTIGPSGRVAAASVVRSSGSAELDDAARTIVRSISPPPPPGGSFSASTTIRFHVE
jgi:protein TonB